MKQFLAVLLVAAAAAGCGPYEGHRYDMVTIEVKLVNSADPIRRQVEVSELEADLISALGPVFPSAFRKVYGTLPTFVINPAGSRWEAGARSTASTPATGRASGAIRMPRALSGTASRPMRARW